MSSRTACSGREDIGYIKTMMNSRTTFFLLLGLFIFSKLHAGDPVVHHWELSSPDARYRVEVFQKTDGEKKRQLYYRIQFGGKAVVLDSELGVLIENRLFESALGIENDPSARWFENLDFKSTVRQSNDSQWHPLYGERSTVRNSYNELTLRFEKFADQAGAEEGQLGTVYDKRRSYEAEVVFRAYDEGIAFRYQFPESKNGLFLHITGEQTQFTMPEGTLAYYERWAQGPYTLRPLKGWTDDAERPLTMKLPTGLYAALLEARMTDYARTKFRLSKSKPNTLEASLYGGVDAITPYGTPWRVIMAAETPGELLENNDILLNLNDSSRIDDGSWIKPGKVIRSGLSTAEAKACVDFAASRNMQYIHLDAGWYGPEMKMASDATRPAANRDIDIQQIVRYADQKNIGVFLYVNQRALVQQIDTLFPLLQKWGVKGVKFGFVQVGSNRWTVWLHEAVRKAAQYRLMVDIHDEYRPTGFSRTYPNLLTQEGIRGNEEMPDATHNTILPFTRYLAGAGDYTICYYSNRIKTTHAHQLALSVVYYSPLQFLYWYDKPALYHEEPEIAFFDKVKTVWDDSRVLSGAIGEHVAVARRSGREWFLGAITNTESRRLKLPCDFLEKGATYIATVYADDSHTPTRTGVKITQRRLTAEDTLDLELMASGGAAIHFVVEGR